MPIRKKRNSLLFDKYKENKTESDQFIFNPINEEFVNKEINKIGFDNLTVYCSFKDFRYHGKDTDWPVIAFI
jgi:hypothetical protein